MAFNVPLSDATALIVPTITIYEVFKRTWQLRGEPAATFAAATMRLGSVIDLDGTDAVSAAELSLKYRLPMADSIILAVSRRLGATLWTQDSDFEGLDNVRYLPAR